MLGGGAFGVTTAAYLYTMFNAERPVKTRPSTKGPNSGIGMVVLTASTNKPNNHDAVSRSAFVSSPLEPVSSNPLNPSPLPETDGPAPDSSPPPSSGPVSEGMEDTETAASNQGAFNPVTGEINWDCPCLGGMAHGPCGPQFREAFSCFVYSEDEPKGINCVEKFKAMQDCFREHPDVYAEGGQLSSLLLFS